MKLVGICGHYGGGKVFLDGQTVKTKILTEELKHQLGDCEVDTVDTFGGIRTVFKQLLGLFRLLVHCSNIVILPAHKSLRLYAPLLVFLSPIFHRRLHYIVIGGWLPTFIKKKRILSWCLRSFDHIYVETSTMRVEMEKQGFLNIHILPNCKNLQILHESEMVICDTEPYSLCTFSRVTEKKGMTEAMHAIAQVNNQYGRQVFQLDIYGQIAPDYQDQFEGLIKEHGSFAKYKGVVPFDKSVEVLKSYYALLFPTKFFTEGVPGTIIDAYAAGIPVIASRWKSFDDVVDHGVVGIGYEFQDDFELQSILNHIVLHPNEMIRMKPRCLKKAEQFSSTQVVRDLVKHIAG